MKEPKIRKIVTNLEEVFYEGGAVWYQMRLTF